MLQVTIMIVLWGGLAVQFFGPDRWEDVGRDVALAALPAGMWLNVYANYPRQRWTIYLAATATFFIASAWLMRLLG